MPAKALGEVHTGEKTKKERKISKAKEYRPPGCRLTDFSRYIVYSLNFDAYFFQSEFSTPEGDFNH